MSSIESAPTSPREPSESIKVPNALGEDKDKNDDPDDLALAKYHLPLLSSSAPERELEPSWVEVKRRQRDKSKGKSQVSMGQFHLLLL